jgi:hypothetical protein
VLAEVAQRSHKSCSDGAWRAAFTAKSPKKGTKLRVIGIPRVNLDILMDEAVKTPGETVTVKGAYEIIVIGVR